MNAPELLIEHRPLIHHAVRNWYRQTLRTNGGRLPFDYDDAYQEACVGILRAPTYDPTKAAISTYVYTYATHGMRHFARSIIGRNDHDGPTNRRRQAALRAVPLDDIVLTAPVDDRADLDALSDAFDVLETMLAPRHAEVLRLRRAGITQTEIGRRLGRSQSSVARTLDRIVEIARADQSWLEQIA